MTTANNLSTNSHGEACKEGVVEHIGPNRVDVRITQASACGGCSLSSHCNAAECRSTLISVALPDAGTYAVGERVRVSTSMTAVSSALWVGFGFPLILLLVGFGAAKMVLGLSEVQAALMGLLLLAVYYIIIYIAQRYIGRKVVFRIEKCNYE